MKRETRLTKYEISIIKCLLKKLNNQYVLHYINLYRQHIGLPPINGGRISQVKNNEIGEWIAAASDGECDEFLRRVANNFCISDIVEAYINSNKKGGEDGYFLSITEDVLIELKKGINMKGKRFDDEILKILQSFANNSGGCIVLGIDNDSKKVVGVRKRVADIDLSHTNNRILDIMSANIELKIKEMSVGGKFIILLCAKECRKKPIMYKKNTEKIRDGDIFYRYNAETRLIGSAEIEEIIEDRIKRFLEVVKNNAIKIEEIYTNYNDRNIYGVNAYISKNGTGVEVSISDGKALEIFPLTYKELVRKVKENYNDVKINKIFHKIMKEIKNDNSLCHKRSLNPKGGKTCTYFYSEDAVKYFGKYYKKK